MPVRTAEEYSERYLEVDRPQPLTDKKIESLIHDVLRGSIKKDITDQVYIDFQEHFKNWLASSKLNKLEGLESFLNPDSVIVGTKLLDQFNIKGPVQT